MAAHHLSFAGLIEAISNAVAQAQDTVEKHQITNLLSYFDPKTDAPRTVMFRVPSASPDASPLDFDYYHVPLLSLVSVNVLRIKDVKLKFGVDMGHVEVSDEPARAAAGAAPEKPAEGSVDDTVRLLRKPKSELNVSTVTGSEGGRFQVTLKVKGSKPTEGAARLLDYLAQLQGVYPTVAVSGKDAMPEEPDEQAPPP